MCVCERKESEWFYDHFIASKFHLITTLRDRSSLLIGSISSFPVIWLAKKSNVYKRALWQNYSLRYISKSKRTWRVKKFSKSCKEFARGQDAKNTIYANKTAKNFGYPFTYKYIKWLPVQFGNKLNSFKQIALAALVQICRTRSIYSRIARAAI